MKTDDVNISVVGTGMVSYRQMTEETKQVLESAEKIFILHPSPEVRQHISEEWGEIIDLRDEYEQNLDREKIYEQMAKRVLKGGREVNGPVALAVYGHPMVGVAPVGFLKREAERDDIEINIYPGISSLDCLYIDLDLDPLDRGLQMFEATDLLVYETDINTTLPTFILQIGLVGSRLYDQRESRPERFTPIREYLEKFYSVDHELCLVRTATFPLAVSEKHWFKLREFESMTTRISPASTLYIPASENQTIQNENAAQKAYSEKYLNEIAQDDKSEQE